MENICGIYKITNDINDKVYIGQSVNCTARWWAHRNSAKRVNAQDAKTAIHTAMREIGIEHFSFEIIEECPIEQLNEKEIYWISYYDSYNCGYNMTFGGESNKGETNGRALLTEEDVYNIRMMYSNHIRFKEAFEKYKDKISKRGFRKVWLFENWRYILPEVYTEENRQWHATAAKANIGGNTNLGENNKARKTSDEDIALIRELRSQGLSYEKISKQVGRSTSVIRKYCLFQEAKKPTIGIQIKNVETGLVFDSQKEAAKWAGCDHHNISKFKNTDKSAGIVPSTNEPAHWVTI